MLVAFVGTHVPLLSLLIYFVLIYLKVSVIVIAFLATLIGTAITLYALHHLLAPITLTFWHCGNTSARNTNLPTEFTDEVTLMADTSHTLKDEVIHYMTSYDDLTDCLIIPRSPPAGFCLKRNNQLLAVMLLSLIASIILTIH